MHCQKYEEGILFLGIKKSGILDIILYCWLNSNLDEFKEFKTGVIIFELVYYGCCLSKPRWIRPKLNQFIMLPNCSVIFLEGLNTHGQVMQVGIIYNNCKIKPMQKDILYSNNVLPDEESHIMDKGVIFSSAFICFQPSRRFLCMVLLDRKKYKIVQNNNVLILQCTVINLIEIIAFRADQSVLQCSPTLIDGFP